MYSYLLSVSYIPLYIVDNTYIFPIIGNYPMREKIEETNFILEESEKML